MSTILKTIDLTKTYPGNKYRSLINFNLEVEKGEITALLGESGCGKTTALRIMAGFEYAEKGSVIINDQIMADESIFVEPNNRGVGIVFQDYALFPHKTVLKNILFGLYKLSQKDQAVAAEKVLNLTDLQGFENRYPHQLSGGQRQRVALARALAPNPGVLLLDEPFSNIDSMKKNLIREEVRSILKKAETTAVFVTHDTKDVLAIADKVAVMKDGVLLQQGAPAHVYNQPVNEYVAHFFGKTNTIDAMVTENTIDSDIGLLPLHLSGLIDIPQKVSFSIRPNAFFLLETNQPDAIPVSIREKIFMGEYTELVCNTNIEGKKSVELFVHISSYKPTTSDSCFLMVDPENIKLIR